jgi:predicted DCC family thiol-disulfide oxidoreductase YuxK
MNKTTMVNRSAQHTAASRHLLLFDGVCALCSGVVQFVLTRDQRRVFDFAPLQSDAARETLERFGRDPASLDTFHIVADYRGPAPAHVERARAALFLMAQLGWPWKAASVLGLLPDVLLNAVYNFVARHRYRVFGRRDQCFLPRPEDRDRFIGE